MEEVLFLGRWGVRCVEQQSVTPFCKRAVSYFVQVLATAITMFDGASLVDWFYSRNQCLPQFSFEMLISISILFSNMF